MIRDPERFKSIAAGLQSLVVAFGFIVGGIWTAVIFTMRAEVQRAQVEIQRAELELERFERGDSALYVELQASYHKKMKVIEATVNFENRGTRDAYTEFPTNEPVCIYKVSWDSEGVLQPGRKRCGTEIFYRRDTGEHGVTTSLVIRGGNSNMLKVIIPADDPGIYAVDFSGNYSIEELEDVKKIDPSDGYKHFGRLVYVTVD